MINIKTDPSWKISAQAGDMLEIDSQIALTGTEDKLTTHVIPVAKSLDFPPDKIFKHLKKSIGQKVAKGDVIAEKDGMFSTRKFVSEFAGTIISVDHHKGEITIEEHTNQEGQTHIHSLVKGKVAKVDDDSINVKTGATKNVSLQETVPQRFGAKVLITSSTQAILLTLPEVKDSVIFVPEISDYIVAKLGALGVLYIVTKSDIVSAPNVLTLADKSEEEIKKLIEFAPKYVYAESGATELIFYQSA